MSGGRADGFLAGAIEGFYGAPWSADERTRLLDWLHGCGLDTYVYAPKDDVHHRARWREPYGAEEAAALRTLTEACCARAIRFVYAIAPGLDIRYSDESDLQALLGRAAQVHALGGDHLAVLFDDIPGEMTAADAARWPSLAAAQAHVANAIAERARQGARGARVLFCPTAYCGRMAAAGLGGPAYLETLGRELLPGVDVFWTGPEIVSREITVPHVREIARLLRRKPVIWDNLHANDYDGRRFFVGPYAGRAAALRDEVNGLLSNPNNELPLNQVPLRTLGRFVHEASPPPPRDAYLEAMAAWLPAFATWGEPIGLDDLILFGDAFYLPYEEGAEAARLLACARRLVSRPVSAWKDDRDIFNAMAARLRRTCARLTELRDRPLFHALSRRVWELREEMDLLERFVAWKADGSPGGSFRSDAHLPGTWRGGLLAQIQQLLRMEPDGAFARAADDGEEAGGAAAAPDAAPASRP